MEERKRRQEEEEVELYILFLSFGHSVKKYVSPDDILSFSGDEIAARCSPQSATYQTLQACGGKQGVHYSDSLRSIYDYTKELDVDMMQVLVVT